MNGQVLAGSGDIIVVNALSGDIIVVNGFIVVNGCVGFDLCLCVSCDCLDIHCDRAAISY